MAKGLIINKLSLGVIQEHMGQDIEVLPKEGKVQISYKLLVYDWK